MKTTSKTSLPLDRLILWVKAAIREGFGTAFLLALFASYAASAQSFTMYVPGAAGSIMQITSAGVQSTLVPVYTFGSPSALAVDGSGNVYVADGSIYKVTTAGAVSTFATGFNEPTGLAFDGNGNLYVADYGNGTLSKVTPGGVVSTFATGFSIDPHAGGNGNLSVACDASGNVYLADYETGEVTEITPAGVTRVFAFGFEYIFNVAVDQGGNVYLADFYGNITKITPGGAVSTLATVSWYAAGLAFDGNGNLYMSHAGNAAVTEITPAGVTSTFAGGLSGPVAIYVPPTTPAITVQPQNQCCVSGQTVPAIFNVAASGPDLAFQWLGSTDGGVTWTPLANGAACTGATASRLIVASVAAMVGYKYECVVTNSFGSVTSLPGTLTNVPFLMYLADEMNNTVATHTPAGASTLFANQVSHPLAFAFDKAGNTYVANQGNGSISLITPAGAASIFATGFAQPNALAFDTNGNLYVADGAANTVSKVTSTGAVSLFCYASYWPAALAFDGTGNLYVADDGYNSVLKVSPAGVVSTFASGFGYPAGLAFDGGGNLYVANWSSNTVSVVSPAGAVRTFASGFNGPKSVAFDASGNLYVANLAGTSDAGSVSKVTPAGTVTQFSASWADLVAIGLVAAPALPTFTLQPQSVTIAAGKSASFTIDVSGVPGSVTFQWRVSTDGGASWTPLSNNANYSGVTSTTLAVTNTTIAMSGYKYDCVATDSVGPTTSNPATLTTLAFLMYVVNLNGDGSSGSISQITPDGDVTTFASGFSGPQAIAPDAAGNIYVADDNILYRYTPAGVGSILATGFGSPTGLAVDPSGNVYETDESDGAVYKISPAGVVSTLATGFGDPSALAVDTNGNVFVADYGSNTVTKITPAGQTSLFARDVFNPEAMAFDTGGNLYAADVIGYIYLVKASSVSTYTTVYPRPHGLGFDPSGNLFVADYNDENTLPEYGVATVSETTPAGAFSTFATGVIGQPGNLAVVGSPAPPTASSYSVTVSAWPSAGGSVTGGGTVPAGSPTLQSVTATANAGYVFANWTENGNVVSTSARYYFMLAGNRNLVANFYKLIYQTLDYPNAIATYAQGVSGTNLVGHYVDSGSVSHGFLYNSAAGFTNLDDPSGLSAQYYGTYAEGISGTNIVGYYVDSNAVLHGFLYNGVTYTTFDDPANQGYGEYGTYATCISGNYIGGYFTVMDAGANGFMLTGTNYVTLHDPNGSEYECEIFGVDGGNAIGFNGLNGFFYNGSSYTAVNAPESSTTYPQGLSGDSMVGYYTDDSGNTHGFLRNHNTYNTLDAPNATATYAQGLSGNTIVGYYVDSSSLNHGFIATMTTVTSTTISLNASPGTGGTVSGGGAFSSGSSDTVIATPNYGFAFVNWTQNGTVVCWTTNYTFVLSSNVALQANFADVQSPVSTIIQPTSGQIWSNSVCTVTGTATDNVAVAWVYCSVSNALFHTGFAPAWSANNWLNWSTNVTLAPGTNTIWAYAVDASGNVSATNRVNVDCILSATLTVWTNGMGSISPNDNGVSLPIGSSQVLTATAAAGFRFTNWTGGAALPLAVLTNGTTLKFVMQSNLVLQANFVELEKPTNTIISPTQGQRWTNAVFLASGKVADNWRLAGVTCQLNGGAWTNGVTANNWSNWTAVLDLVPGTNFLSAYAVDIGGNRSATNTVSFQFVVSNQLQIRAIGLGAISPNYSNSWLNIGQNYCITSSPAFGFVATNWIISTNWLGGALTNSKVVQFMMESNLTLEVNFADVTRPTNTITSPNNGQHMSNALATVLGKASDNWKVAGVCYQLNNSPWSVAETTNGWTNWTTTVPLIVGTNIVRAYAIDLAGNLSTTSTVSIISSNTFRLQLAFSNSVPLRTNGLVFNLQLSAGLNGHIQASSNLINWTTMTNFTGTNSTITFRDPSATNSSHRFYRAVIP